MNVSLNLVNNLWGRGIFLRHSHRASHISVHWFIYVRYVLVSHNWRLSTSQGKRRLSQNADLTGAFNKELAFIRVTLLGFKKKINTWSIYKSSQFVIHFLIIIRVELSTMYEESLVNVNGLYLMVMLILSGLKISTVCLMTTNYWLFQTENDWESHEMYDLFYCTIWIFSYDM